MKNISVQIIMNLFTLMELCQVMESIVKILVVRYLSRIMLLDSNSQLWYIELIFYFFVNHFWDTSCFYVYFFEFLGLKYNVFISK